MRASNVSSAYCGTQLLNPFYESPTMRGHRDRDLRRGGRAVECTGLENRHRLIAYPGFESLPLRHYLWLSRWYHWFWQLFHFSWLIICTTYCTAKAVASCKHSNGFICEGRHGPVGVCLICVYRLCNTPNFSISHFKILLSAANDVDNGAYKSPWRPFSIGSMYRKGIPE